MTGQPQPHPFEKLPHPYIHHKKCWTHYFNKVISGEKPWEKRVWDTDYQTGDTLILEEWNPGSGYSGRSAGFVIGYILDGEFARPGECLMTLKTICGRDSCKGCPKEYKGCTEQSHSSAGAQQRIEQVINQLETEARVLRSDAREYSDYMRSARAAGIERAIALLQEGRK